jgi:hypothetical protein
MQAMIEVRKYFDFVRFSNTVFALPLPAAPKTFGARGVGRNVAHAS